MASTSTVGDRTGLAASPHPSQRTENRFRVDRAMSAGGLAGGLIHEYDGAALDRIWVSDPREQGAAL